MLTLLETAAQAHWFVQSQSRQADRGAVLAITPEAAYACQQLGQPYLKLEDYAQVSKRLSEYGAMLPRYLEWEAWLDNWAQQAVPAFGATGFKPASGASFLLQFLFAEIWTTTACLHEFLDAIRPAEVALWPPQIARVPWYLHPAVSSLPALLPAIASARGIGVVDLAAQSPDLSPISAVSDPPSGIKRLVWWAKAQLYQNPIVAELLVAREFDLASYLKPYNSHLPRILFSGYGYDLLPLGRELRRQGTRVTVLPDTLPPVRLAAKFAPLSPALRSALSAAGLRLLQEPGLWTLPTQLGLERLPLWGKSLHFWWHQFVPEVWLNYQHVQRLLKRYGFTALVTWDRGGSTLSGAAAHAAAVADVPRYIYQHGSSSEVDAKSYQMYLRHGETFLAYGQGTVDGLQQSCPEFLQPCASIVPVGSARLDLLRRRHRSPKARRLRAELQAGDGRPLVMYVPTCFGGYGRAVSDLAAYPDVSYFELQQAILKLWSEAPGVRLVYKDFIVASDPNRVMPDFIREHIPDAIITHQGLTSLMWAVDAIVIDHVVTAIGEVLLTNKPLLVYMPQPNVASPQAKIMLQKRATVVETPKEFMTQVRAFLRAGQYAELEKPNTEFLQAYGTYLDDGRSAERAAAVVLQRTRQDQE